MQGEFIISKAPCINATRNILLFLAKQVVCLVMWSRPWCLHLKIHRLLKSKHHLFMDCMHLNACYIFIDFVHFFYLFYLFCPMWVFYRCVLPLLITTKSMISMLLSIEGAKTSHNCSLMSLGKVILFNGNSFFKLSHIFAHLGTSLNTNQQLMKVKLMCFGCFNL
jgi:hypothetical protein